MSGTKNHLMLMSLHCEKIISKMHGKSFEDWAKDENLRDAVCMRLMSLSECIKEYLKECPALPYDYDYIPWDDIARFRDKIAHHYEGIDFDLVWEILDTDIPPLREVIEDLKKRASFAPA
ncbi:MAG: DUF86 domain-containing protein [Desulfovibrionaceae bacterium]|nr:DUF86 domain-containing protein [Desulfovibrionaceae bacterium]